MSNTSTKFKNAFFKLSILCLFVALILLGFFATPLFENKQPVLATVSTEQNKIYTNEYIEYLALSDEEKAQTSVIPRMYEVDFSSLYSSSAYQTLSGSSLPSEYSLVYVKSIIENFSDENKLNYETLNKNVGNQSGTGICWSFASTTALETTLYKANVVTEGETLNFSELHLAYTSQMVNRGENSIYGGNFDLAYEYFSGEYGPVYEGVNESYGDGNSSNWANDKDAATYYKNTYYNNAVKSNYRAYEAFSYPSRSDCETEEQVTELRNSIKNHIKSYGAVTASIYMSSDNFHQSKRYIYTGASNQNHMITLVGWDDDYEYPGTSYKGAYIAQNSYGTDWSSYGGYFYIMYDDVLVEENINGFVRVGTDDGKNLTYNNMVGKKNENQFVTFNAASGRIYYSGKAISSNYYISNVYKTSSVANQYLSQIKVPTTFISTSSNFYVYFLDGLTTSDINTDQKLMSALALNFNKAKKIKNKYNKTSDEYLFTSNQTGFYTIEINEQINVTGDYFAIYMQLTSGTVMYMDNVDASKMSNTYDYTYSSDTAISWTPYYMLKKLDNGYYTDDTEKPCVLPMMVKTEYSLSTIDYAVSDYEGTYDAENHSIDVIVTSPATYTVSYKTEEDGEWQTTKPTFKNVGTYSVYYKIEADFHTTVVGCKTVKINKKDLLVTPHEDGKTYGDKDGLKLWYGSSGSYEEPDFTGSLVRESGESVGKYLISIGTLALANLNDFNKDNYNLVFDSTPVYYTISKRVIVLTPDKQTKIYGDSDPAELTYNLTNIFEEETPCLTGTLMRTMGEDVGEYDILLNDVALADKDNFKISNYSLMILDNENAFEIIKRVLTIEPDQDQKKDYLDADPQEFTYTCLNAAFGETPKFSGGLAREQGESAGDYLISIGSLAMVDNLPFKASNYTLNLSSTPVYFRITLGKLTGCVLNKVVANYTATYHGLNPSCTDFTEVRYLYSTDNHTWSETPIKYKDVGTYTVYVKFDKENYSTTTLSNQIEINPIDLTVVPNVNQRKIYGDFDPELTYNCSGSINGEVPAFSGKLTRVEGENVSSYLINQGTLSLIDNTQTKFLAKNYVLVYSNTNEIKFEITKRNLVVTPDSNLTKIYGKADEVFTYTYSNTAYGQTPGFSGNLSRVEGEDVDKYEILLGSLKLENNEDFLTNNYQICLSSNIVEFEILPASITITINNESSYYDGENVISNFSSVVTGDYVEGDELNIVYSCPVTKQTKKGEYKISAKASNDNYLITIVDGTYTVNYKMFDVVFKVLGETVYTTQVEHFSTVPQNEVPVVSETGYNFLNWQVEYSNNSYLPVSSPTQFQIVQNVTFVASMELILYHIKYNLNEGSFAGDTLRSFTFVTETFELDDPERTGYDFGGWFDNEAFVGERVSQIEKGTSKDITLYAKWIIKEYSIMLPELMTTSYCITYENPTTVKYLGSFDFSVELATEYSQSYKTLKVYAKNTESEERKELTLTDNKKYIINNIDSNFEIILEGININIYKIFFMADGKAFHFIERESGSTIDLSDYPEIPMDGKENYSDTPAYWDRQEVNNITKDEFVSAVYVPNVYNITFVMQDGSKVATSVTYGERVSEEALKEAYNLNMFEYFVYDVSLDGITEDTIINVKIKSNIYILYIVLASLGGIISIAIISRVIRRKKRNKFNWWLYASSGKSKGGNASAGNQKGHKGK